MECGGLSEPRAAGDPAPAPFSPRQIAAVGPDGEVWTGVGETYRLARLAPSGDTLRVVELAMPPTPLSAAERRAALDRIAQLEAQGFEVDAGRIPDVHPRFTGLVVADTGDLWVYRVHGAATPPDAPAATWDVFDADGRYLASVPATTVADPAPHVGEHFLVGVARDRMGVEYVEVPPRRPPRAGLTSRPLASSRCPAYRPGGGAQGATLASPTARPAARMPRIVDAVVLAAGRSSRMGEPKPLLEVDGETFLAHAIRVLREGGCRYVVAVLNADADWAQRLADVSGAAVVLNPDAGSEQIDSLRLGLAAVPGDGDGVAVLPVDLPRLQAATVTALVERFAAGAAAIVLPEHEGETGHPVLLARALFAELESAALPEGVRSLLAAHAADIERVPVDDAGVLLDVDTPDDYRRATGPA